MNYPLISIWVTSIGRWEYLRRCLKTFCAWCTYPNIEIIIRDSLVDVNNPECSFIETRNINSDKAKAFFDQLPSQYPNIHFDIKISPFRPLIEVYQDLLDSSNGDYFLNIEDDSMTVRDPDDPDFIKDCMRDGVETIATNDDVLAVNMQLNGKWLDHLKVVEKNGIDYRIWHSWWCSYGNLTSTKKARAINIFNFTLPPEDYYKIEVEASKIMVNNNLICLIQENYWGFLAHMGHYGVNGSDRRYLTARHIKRVEDGYIGRRK